MNPLLIRRRGMMMAAGGTPYQEIEYIGTTSQDGSVFLIDTGITRGSNFSSIEFEFKAKFNNKTLRQIHGAVNNSYCGVNNSKWEGKYNGYYGTADLNVHTFKRKTAKEGTMWHFIFGVDGVTLYEQVGYGWNDNYFDTNLYIFNIGASYNLGLLANLYWEKIRLNDILVFDGIPVRVGTVGYIYDRVSGQLFGNLGTGDFVLGPDVQ